MKSCCEGWPIALTSVLCAGPALAKYISHQGKEKAAELAPHQYAAFFRLCAISASVSFKLPLDAVASSAGPFSLFIHFVSESSCFSIAGELLPSISVTDSAVVVLNALMSSVECAVFLLLCFLSPCWSCDALKLPSCSMVEVALSSDAAMYALPAPAGFAFLLLRFSLFCAGCSPSIVLELP